MQRRRCRPFTTLDGMLLIGTTAAGLALARAMLDHTTRMRRDPTWIVATINYLDVDAQPQRVDNATLPWSRLLTTDEPVLFADLRAQGNGDVIGCRITVNGVVKDERSISDVNGYIACLDKSA